MKNYELSVMFHPDLEMNIDPALEKVQKIIEKYQGKIIRAVNEGKKRLAYPIKTQDFAIYYYYDVELPVEAPVKVANVLNITEEVLRYLLVVVDEKKAKMEIKSDENEDNEDNKEDKGEK